MTERKCTVFIFLGFFNFYLLFRFIYFCKKNNNKSYNKNTQSDEQSRRSISNLCFGCLTDKSTHQNVAGNCCC